MKEEFLHFLWKYSLYDKQSLFNNEGAHVTVIHPGEYNRDAGPDFFNARISVSGTIWAGNIEIHIKSSHFDLHGHQFDHSYDNLILHIVAENDKKVYSAKGEELPTAVLRFDKSLIEAYNSLINNPYIIACQDDIMKIDKIQQRNWIESLVIERLEKKSVAILKILSETNNNWEETFYRLLSRYFGFRVNTEPFERLARALPLNIIKKHADNRLQVESLLYGTAGFLEDGLFKDALVDNYYRDLLREYKMLSVKYSLNPLHGWIWKFAKLRPANFPTIRISQLAGLLVNTDGLFSRVLEAGNINELIMLFKPEASEYWNNHYVFGSLSAGKPKKAGVQAADIILINSIIPALYTYGKTRDMVLYTERAVNFLENIKPENNSIIIDWIKIGIKPDSALSSQALLQLRDSYCRKRRCLDCRIGFKLISLGKKMKEQDTLILEP